MEHTPRTHTHTENTTEVKASLYSSRGGEAGACECVPQAELQESGYSSFTAGANIRFPCKRWMAFARVFFSRCAVCSSRGKHTHQDVAFNYREAPAGSLLNLAHLKTTLAHFQNVLVNSIWVIAVENKKGSFLEAFSFCCSLAYLIPYGWLHTLINQIESTFVCFLKLRKGILFGPRRN